MAELSREECLKLLKDVHCPQQVILHSLKVCEKAIALNEQLCSPFGQSCIMNASLLHDILRERPHHASEGAQFLRERGLEKVASIVACHHDLNDEHFDERMIVYLADKYVRDDQEVSLEVRFLSKLESFTSSQAKEACLKRYEQAKKIERLYEGMCQQ